MMDEAVKSNYVEAGRIAREARDQAVDAVHPGATCIEIAETAEQYIRSQGAEPAFPVNISVNDVAAHYSPAIGDEATIPEDALVNVDVGAHVDGYIGDTAATVDLCGDYSALVDAAADALDAALEIVAPGVTLSEIGAAIEDAAAAHGVTPVRNLSGHGLDAYTQHTGKTIPNIETGNDTQLEEGEAIAIEPFMTDGAGAVRDGKPGNIYRVERESVRGRIGRKIMGEVSDRFRTLPFSPRWIDGVPAARVPTAVQNLVRSGALHAYDTLVEEDGGMVAQKEHTVIVAEDPVVTTR